MALDPNELGCRFLAFLLRRVYGFRVYGLENMPSEGPYIVLNTEWSFLCILCDAAASATLLLKPFREKKLMTFVGEEFWAVGFFRKFSKVISSYPLLPHGAGQYGLHMLQALDHLRHGGVVVMNPEGDMSRDGRPIPIRDGVAWLALHSAAPIVPLIVTAGAYDIWPTWKARPSLRGRVAQTVGMPFRLVETPLASISQEDLEKAKARIRAEIDRLCYGPDGLTAWVGRPTYRQSGQGVPRPARPDPVLPTAGAEGQQPARPRKRGLPLLLWRCPVCGVDDALIQARAGLRKNRLQCQSCGTAWQVQRVPGKDFRLTVVEGGDGLLGLDMALSAWYDRIRENFKLCPLPVSGLDLTAGEEVYLRTEHVTLLLHQSSSLLSGAWKDGEPPATELPKTPGAWGRLGPGSLWLTNRRFVWDGPPARLDFCWSRVTAVSLRLYYLLGVHYGATPYRFWLSGGDGIKWLTYAGTVARQIAVPGARMPTLSPF